MNQPSTRVANRSGISLTDWSAWSTFIAAAYVWIAIWLAVWSLIPTLLGWQPLVVHSDSMAPTIRAGDVVVVSPYQHTVTDLEGAAVGAGTVVAFRSEVDDRLILHRIRSFEGGVYRTQGDANRTIDSAPVAPDQVEGVARILVPWVGLPFHWLAIGRWWLAVVAVTSLVLAWWSQRAANRAMAHGLFRIRGKARHASDDGRLPRRARRRIGVLVVLVLGTLGAVLTAGRLAEAALSDPSSNIEDAFDADAWQIAATAKFTCRNTSLFEGWCWGENTDGQLGDGTKSDRSVPVGVRSLLESAGSVPAGGVKHTCVVETDGSVLCWGDNSEGQLGDGSTTDSSVPVQVVGVGGTGTLGGVSQVAAGELHTCALTTSGAVFCWGRNDKGQLGDGTTTDSESPVQVVGVGGTGTLTNVTHLTAGNKHTCAARTDTTVVCWGANSEGQLGDGSTTDSSVPVQVVGVGGTGTLGGVNNAGAGTKHSCAVASDHRMYCWGENADGQLGIASTNASSSPKAVVGGPQDPLAPVLTAAAGLRHSCMSLMDLTVVCWGRNDRGQLGDGTTTDEVVPVQVVGVSGTGYLTGVRQVVAGDEHSCALRSDTTVICWGRNDKGQLGNNKATGDTPVPQQVKGVGGSGNLTGITWLSAGAEHTCAVSSSGTVFCWGMNGSGQLGDGTTTDRSVPVQVVGVAGTGTLGSIRQVGVGANHSCAVSSASQVYCWGSNNSGQLGDNTTSSRASPGLVVGVGGTGTLSNVRWVDGGTEHTCASSLADTAYCWGRNDRGQVGDGTTVNPRPSPRQVVSTSGSGTLSPVAAVAAGSEHSCAFRRDATSGYCWGRNDKGQLGNGGGADSPVPVATTGP